MSRLPFHAALACLASLSFAAPSRGQSFQGLGFFPNGSSSFANGLSPDGCTVVGFGDILGGGGLQGFRWTASTGMSSIGYFPNPGSIPWSRAQAISGRSALIVGFSAKHDTTGNFGAPVLWTSCTGLIYLGKLDGPTPDGYASGVSYDGSIVVGTSANAASQNTAFKWTKQDGMTELQPMAGQNSASAADTSDDGSVIVGSASTGVALNPKAVQWVNGNVSLLPSLVPAGVSFAAAVTRNGTVIVGQSGGRAVRWVNGAIQSLGVVPGQNPATLDIALAVSDNGGVIVGYADYSPTFGTQKAFIWDATNGIRYLAPELVTVYGLNLGNFDLRSATGLSGDGRVISGNGLNNGIAEAWIARLANVACP